MPEQTSGEDETSSRAGPGAGDEESTGREAWDEGQDPLGLRVVVKTEPLWRSRWWWTGQTESLWGLDRRSSEGHRRWSGSSSGSVDDCSTGSGSAAAAELVLLQLISSIFCNFVSYTLIKFVKALIKTHFFPFGVIYCYIKTLKLSVKLFLQTSLSGPQRVTNLFCQSVTFHCEGLRLPVSPCRSVGSIY